MATRRVRRDSETSTDSWSLVEEDRLEDDFSVNSTEAEEYSSDEEAQEPIVEEPPTSEEDTASEDSDSDSDCDSDSDSDLSTADEEEMEDANSELSGGEQEEEEGLKASDDDSDSDSDSEDSENDDEEDSENSEDSEDSEDDDEEEEEEEDELTTEQAARLLKEECTEEEPVRAADDDTYWPTICFRTVFFLSVFITVFPIADFFTNRVLNQSPYLPPHLRGHGPQRHASQKFFTLQSALEKKKENVKVKADPLKNPKKNQYYNKNIEESNFIFNVLGNSSSSSSLFLGNPMKIEKRDDPAPPKNNRTISIPSWARPICQKALAPIPPAPFTPRRSIRQVIPLHQPCLVHVNQSKWTCQKRSYVSNVNVPMVVKKSAEVSVSVSPRKFGISKRKIYKKADLERKEKKFPGEICGKKASESMRTVSKSKDQCDSRHFSKYTPRRRQFSKHGIEFKAPLPCELPAFRPTMPKPSKKPSKSADDWFSRRGHVRAQLRSRA